MNDEARIVGVAPGEESVPAGRVAFLDALRIFAFLSVLIGHKFYGAIAAAAEDRGLHLTLRTAARIAAPFFWAGGAGVIVFFLVSGYIITQVLTREAVPDFLAKRIFRIYPLYIAAVLLETALDVLVRQQALPPLSVMVPRLLLLGDAFGTPYALAGVEWTLRVEVLFYLIMAGLKALGLMDRPARLPWLYMLITVFVQAAGPFQTHHGWTDGFITLYLPFLFLGSLAFLHERRMMPAGWGLLCAAYIYVSYLVLLPGINPRGADSNFLTIGCLVGLALWLVRGRLHPGAAMIFVSDLTYSVYLFHNWGWTYLNAIVRAAGVREAQAPFGVLLLLFLFCYLMHRLVERPGIGLGRRVSQAWQRRMPKRPVTAGA
jgi:peptidoglycan/LPS O-acetylase OafA/YrhL